MQIDQLCAILGQGSQNTVYSVKNNSDIVIKIAKSSTLNLQKQSDILSTLDKTGCFPKIFSLGKMLVGINASTNLPAEASFLVMQKLGISLQEFMDLRHGNVNLSTVKKVGIQLLQKIKFLHSFNIVHNDIKPANILFGLKEKRNELFIIDFGMAEKQQDISINSFKNDYQQVGSVFKGNIKFSSLRKLKGYKSTKIDDLQSLLYLLIWMLVGGKSISQLSGLHKRTDFSKQNLRQNLQFQFEAKEFFIQNSQILLSEKLSSQRLNLSLKICDILQHFHAECSQQKLETFYQSIQTVLSSHK